MAGCLIMMTSWYISIRWLKVCLTRYEKDVTLSIYPIWKAVYSLVLSGWDHTSKAAETVIQMKLLKIEKSTFMNPIKLEQLHTFMWGKNVFQFHNKLVL